MLAVLIRDKFFLSVDRFNLHEMESFAPIEWLESVTSISLVKAVCAQQSTVEFVMRH